MNYWDVDLAHAPWEVTDELLIAREREREREVRKRRAVLNIRCCFFMQKMTGSRSRGVGGVARKFKLVTFFQRARERESESERRDFLFNIYMLVVLLSFVC